MLRPLGVKRGAPIFAAFLIAATFGPERLTSQQVAEGSGSPLLRPSGPAIVDLDSALKSKGLPNIPFILRLSAKRWAEFTRGLPRDSGPVPPDCSFVVAFPLPSLRPEKGGIEFTPSGDVGLTNPCFSTDPSMLCIPEFGRPGTGPLGGPIQITGCHCIRTEDAQGPPGIPAPFIPQRIACGLTITATGFKCAGNCGGPGRRCQAALLGGSAATGWVVTCRCRESIRGT
jgi:hypothetical protein